MLREAGVEAEASTAWTFESAQAADSTWASRSSRRESHPDWRSVDRALRTIARRHAALDAEEARWLREAERCQLWRRLGMVSAIDYMERVLGYAPRTGQDRMRVARALGALPRLTAALAQGKLPFSAIRELTRVATPATEAAWCTAALGKNLRQIEELVADHKPGDRPEDPGDPEARTHVVRFELSAGTFAALRQVRQILEDEHGSGLSDDELVAALCDAVLDGAPASESTGRARFQIAVTVCERCRQGWQEGAGAKLAISAAAVERATCDAQHIGSLDGTGPERAHQDVPPSVARFVWRRDGGRCRVPGCRSSRGLEIHHLIHRADGGSHDPPNLILACSACHAAHHDGVLRIRGTADRLEVERRAAPRGIDPAADARVGAVMKADDRAGELAVAVAAAVPMLGAHVGVTADTANDTLGAHVGVDMVAVTGYPGATETVRVDATAVVRTDGLPDEIAGPADACVRISNASFASREHPRSASDTPAPTWASDKLEAAVARTQAKAALIGLGWKPVIANAAVTAAMEALGPGATLERLIFEALRRCPRPTG